MYNLYLKLRDKYSLQELADKLFLHTGTLKRWEELKEVPKNYELLLRNIANENIDYTTYSFKEKDQFFTNESNADYAVKKVLSSIQTKDYIFIEPSAGDGIFVKALLNNEISKDRIIALDIEPRAEGIIKQNFLEYIPDTSKKYIMIGNPPFGLRGNLALMFFRKAAEFCDYVCFILPQLFESDGKGSPNSRITDFNLLSSEKLEDNNFRFPTEENVKVNAVFQIWKKGKRIKEQKPKCDCLKIVSISNGNTSSSKRNVSYIGKCDAYIPSTCFGENNVKVYFDFNDLPNQRGYGIIFIKDKASNIEKLKNSIKQCYYKSTNNALNTRTSEIVKIFSS